MVTLTLPYPPTVNHLYATVHGRKVLSAKGRDYHEAVWNLVNRAQVQPFGEKRVAYHVTVFPPDKRKRDLSNLVKAMEDALTKAGIWDDDSQVDRLTFERAHVAKGGSIFVEIQEMT